MMMLRNRTLWICISKTVIQAFGTFTAPSEENIWLEKWILNHDNATSRTPLS
jgi:hypothetical protein